MNSGMDGGHRQKLILSYLTWGGLVTLICVLCGFFDGRRIFYGEELDNGYTTLWICSIVALILSIGIAVCLLTYYHQQDEWTENERMIRIGLVVGTSLVPVVQCLLIGLGWLIAYLIPA